MNQFEIINKADSRQNAANSFFGASKNAASFIQPKLTINQPNDVYEQEADAMADKVMRMEQPGVQLKPLPITGVQRKCAHCEEEEKQAQRKEINNGGITASGNLESYVGGLSGSGQRLPDKVRNFYEPRFGYDFSSVKVHTDTVAAKSAQSINALAYTSGNNIVFNAGQYAPDTESGKRLMGHELTHVVQQSAGVQTKLIQAARLPCTTRTTIDVYAVSLPGSSRNATTDVDFANTVLCQCGVNINLVGGESWQTDLLDRTAPVGVLNDSNTAATTELTEMTSYRPGGDVIHIYYVPSNSFGDRGGSYGYAGITPTLPLSVSVTNLAAQDTMAHELGHALAADSSHHANADNLLASGAIRNVGVDELEQNQCSRMP